MQIDTSHSRDNCAHGLDAFSSGLTRSAIGFDAYVRFCRIGGYATERSRENVVGGFMISAYDGRRALARRSSNANRFMKQSMVRCGACDPSQISFAYHLTSRCHESNARSFWSLVENACAGHSRRFAERTGDRRKYFLRATRTVQRTEHHTNSKCPWCGYQKVSLFLSLSLSLSLLLPRHRSIYLPVVYGGSGGR